MSKQTWTGIAVVGAGAIGCYFGGLLARTGSKVTLIGRPVHVAAINASGLRLERLGRLERVPIDATEHISGVRDAQLILFCVKSVDTEDAARKMAAHLAPDAVVLSLQNGVNNVERIRMHVNNATLPVLIYAAAEMAGAGTVEHTGGGNLVIGRTDDADSTQRLVNEIAAFFIAAGIPVRVSADIQAELWSKLVMNCAYNAISALTGARYAVMVAMPEVRGVMGAAVEEVIAVAHAKHIRLPDDIIDAAFKLADAMPQTISSTAQDILKGKRTEIDHLNGYVVRQGEALGISTPVNRTLTALTRLLERAKLDASSSGNERARARAPTGPFE